jgi:mannosyltransferase OCH1-like enzyme
MAPAKSNTTMYILVSIVILVIIYVYDNELSYKINMFNVPFHIPRKNNSGPKTVSDVPLVIYESWSSNTVPEKMKDNIYTLLESNPEFDYYLYSDEASYDFIKKHFDNDVAEAFKTLKPGAYKSDLWRYCVLYINGGVYMDIKYTTVVPLIDIIKKTPTVYVNDRDIDLIGVHGCFYNGFMISPPNNIVLKECIDEIVENCKKKLYRINPLDVTGPCLLGRMIEKHDKTLRSTNKYRYDEPNFLFRTGYIMYDDKPMLKTYPEYRIEQEMKQTVEHYGTLWLKSDIYNI